MQYIFLILVKKSKLIKKIKFILDFVVFLQKIAKIIVIVINWVISCLKGEANNLFQYWDYLNFNFGFLI